MNIGEKIKQHRVAQNLTLTQLEKLTGIDNGNLSRIEREQQSLTNGTMRILAKALGLSLAQLFEDFPDESIISNRHKAGGDRCPPVSSFHRLRDIPVGDTILIDGIIVQNGEPGEAQWKKDALQQRVFIGDTVRHLDSNPNDLVSFEISDDTMTPRLFASDCVVIDTGDKTIPSTGGTFAIVSKDRPIEIRRLFIKAGAGLMIVCDNNRYPAINLSADEANFVSIIGRVKAMRGNSGF